LVLENKDISEIYFIYDDLNSNKGLDRDIADDYINAMGIVKGEWFTAFALFECSLERLVEYMQHLDQLIQGELNAVSFINESGNFELNISLDRTTGHVLLKGLIMKSLNEESMLEYSLASDEISLRRFCDSFKSLLKTQFEK
jgi:hypothetical protein